MDAARVDEATAQTSLGFVENLLLRPVVLEKVFRIIRVLVAAWCVARNDCIWSYQIAVVESAVSVFGQVDRNECHVSWRKENIDVHDGTLDEESFGSGAGHDGGP